MRSVARIPAMIAVLLIRAYQKTLARLMQPRCRFVPSCSEYTAEAIEANGLIRGVAAGAWRLIRCGPWTAGGFDPVHVHRGADNG
jgi:putative membrane protein insertion efficiency factor